MKAPKFHLVFTDNTQLEGDTFRNDWKNIPANKNIKSFSFAWGGVAIFFENYRQYNHFVVYEAKNEHTYVLSKILIMARLENVTDIITYDLKTKKAQKDTVAIGHEYKLALLPAWREGVKDAVPYFRYGNF
jgi:hypothetical protein